MNNQELTKFEFLLTMDGNIVVQRFFFVKGHNPKAKRSVDLYECVTNICLDIEEDLKKKTFEYMTSNPHFSLSSEYVEDEKESSNEHFLVEIKLDNDVFIQRTFPAFVYHPKVRYTVDIRPKIKTILSLLTETLSQKNVETSYLNHDLNVKIFN